MILGTELTVWRRFLLLVLMPLAAACAAQPVEVTPEPVVLQLVVADSFEPSAARAAEEYETAHPWVTVHYQVFNTELAEQVLREGGADVALLSWLTEPERAGGSLWTERIRRDGVVVIVHPEFAMHEIGLGQLRDIFAGRVQDWGGDPVIVVSREDGSGTRAAFESVVLHGVSPTLNAVVMPSSEAMVQYVAGTPGAIGYVALAHVDGRVRVLPVDGVLPTRDAIDEGRYPLWRQLFLASNGEPAGEVREFAQWLLSEGSVDLPALRGSR